MERYDVVVIGGGVNGLAAAARLAQSGFAVLVLERGEQPEAAALAGEIVPGFKAPPFALPGGYLDPNFVCALDLGRHGLRTLRLDGGVSLFGDGRYVASYTDAGVMTREIQRHNKRDASAWTRFARDMQRQARRLEKRILEEQQDPARRSPAVIRKLVQDVRELVQKPAHELHDEARVWLQSMDAFLDGYFRSDHLKAHIASAALPGHAQGPCGQTTAALLPLLWIGERSGGMPARLMPQGGLPALTKAIANALKAAGGDIRFGAEVVDVRMEGRKAAGVVLSDDTEIAARCVLSDLDVKHSYLGLFNWSSLPKRYVEEIGHFRTEGVTAQLDLALSGFPEFPDLPEGCPALAGGLRLPGFLDDMEWGFDDWQDHTPPRRPLIDMSFPSLADPSLAPEGKHLASITLHYVPYELHDGSWSGARRAELVQLVLKKLEAVSPGFIERIEGYRLALPRDIEEQTGHTHGDPFAGQMNLDQLFFNRPVPGFAAYEGPVENFYLCSASAHPGGAGLGIAGYNVAEKLLGSLNGGSGLFRRNKGAAA